MTIPHAATNRFPNLPAPLKNGTGARVGSVVYAGLGTAGACWYGLDLADGAPRWVEMAAFPGAPREQARAAVVGGRIYVFGGAGQSVDPAGPVVMFDEVHCYDPVANAWHKQPTRGPLGMLGSALWSPDDSQVLSVGGANKAILDGYFADMAAAGDDAGAAGKITEAYFDQRPQDYLFTSQVLSYTPATNRWMNLGPLPFPPTVGAAVAVGSNHLAVVNGELKPGLRSRDASTATFDGAQLHWATMPDLIGADDDTPQEGLAGAFAGCARDVLLVAGGTNFPGSWAAFRVGDNWAHRGLTKTWHDTIFALVRGQWQVVGKLPSAMASGLSFDADGGVLLVGGELQGGAASAEVMVLGFDGNAATIV